MPSPVCPWWLAYTFDNPLRRLIHRPEVMLAEWVKPGLTVLDVGCGMGHFTLGLARMVGEGGRVIAVDLQQRMLDVTLARASRAGLADRVTPHRCEPTALGLTEAVDFAICCWVVHEVPDQRALLSEVGALLKPEARWLVAEPKGHVSAAAFEATVALAGAVGLTVVERPPVALSRAVLLARA